MVRTRKRSQFVSDSNGNPSSEDMKPQPENLEVPDYEKQRQLRIAENKARLEALGLRQMAKSVMGSRGKKEVIKGEQKGKKAVDEDEEYIPHEDKNAIEQELDVSSDWSEEFEEEDLEKGVQIKRSRCRSRKVSRTKSRSKKKPTVKKPMVKQEPDETNEDKAFLQAIALSLKSKGVIKDSEGTPGGSSFSSVAQSENVLTESKSKGQDHEDAKKGKRRKSFTSRTQMNEDDVVIHFCQFDEAGKGGITLKDLQRMAIMHDFTWTDKDLHDMIRCFDSDRDGKVTLEDFRNIVIRCNMLQVSHYFGDCEWH